MYWSQTTLSKHTCDRVAWWAILGSMKLIPPFYNQAVDQANVPPSADSLGVAGWHYPNFQVPCGHCELGLTGNHRTRKLNRGAWENQRLEPTTPLKQSSLWMMMISSHVNHGSSTHDMTPSYVRWLVHVWDMIYLCGVWARSNQLNKT